MCVCVYEYIRGKENMWYIMTIRIKKTMVKCKEHNGNEEKKKLNLILKNV